MGKKEAMVNALVKEIKLRKKEFEGTVVETIYFGGGTPSVLETTEIEQLITAVYDNYQVGTNPEITLEANPDDLAANVTSSAVESLNGNKLAVSKRLVSTA